MTVVIRANAFLWGSQLTEALTASYARWRSKQLGQITDALEQRLLVAMLTPVTGKRLLDVGCGDGALASDLARRGAIVTGLDADVRAIAAARTRRAPVPGLLVGQAERLPFADATFDRVVAVTVLCFVEHAEQAIAEMTRVLRPGGRLVIGELGYWSLWAAQRRLRAWLGNPIWREVKFRTARELGALAQAAGLTAIKTRGAIYYPPFAVAAKLLGPVDVWMGQRTAFGAAFLALAATKPVQMAGQRSQ
jgi:ubiquinone/menaquinone biosynthesis C-methylase UbiE